MGAECCKQLCRSLHPYAADSLKDSSGRRVDLGTEFSVLTDTSDDEDQVGAGERDDFVHKQLTTPLLSDKNSAIPLTVVTPIQIGANKGGGKRTSSLKSAKNGAGVKKKVRAL
ncbi:M99 [Muromegalovirus G4]|uniref:Cytoplasmic envelopment protein 3 n=1 Tax=Muromegalovirus G4 TaxID=524650 RepID=B3UX46_MUHV1|nr:M99 [Muromegalovirus G4]QNL29242.1 M99 [Muromegalovirus G4]